MMDSASEWILFCFGLCLFKPAIAPSSTAKVNFISILVRQHQTISDDQVPSFPYNFMPKEMKIIWEELGMSPGYLSSHATGLTTRTCGKKLYEARLFAQNPFLNTAINTAWLRN